MIDKLTVMSLSLSLFTIAAFSRELPIVEKGELMFSKDCSNIKNKSSAAVRNNHRAILLSDCLSYFLRDRAFNKTGYREHFTSAPPTTDNQRVNVKVSSVEFTDFSTQVSPFRKMLHGTAKFSWKDSRLTWNRYEWNMNVLKFDEPYGIWIPEPEWYKSDWFNSNFKKVSVSYDGIVSAEMTFVLQGLCYELPGEVIPFELMGCCGEFGTSVLNEVRQYTIDTRAPSIRVAQQMKSRLFDPAMIGGGSVANVPKMWAPLISREQLKPIHLCARLRTVSKVERSRLLTPIGGAAALVLAAPLFGAAKLQLGVKLFAFLLQFLCFDHSLGVSPNNEWIETVPVVYRFHELTFVITLISIFLTLISMGFASVTRRLPPAHWCQLLANCGLKYLSFGGQADQTQPSDHQINMNGATTTINNLDKTATTVNYTNEWKNVIFAVHNLMCLLLSLIYCVVTVYLFI